MTTDYARMRAIMPGPLVDEFHHLALDNCTCGNLDDEEEDEVRMTGGREQEVGGLGWL